MESEGIYHLLDLQSTLIFQVSSSPWLDFVKKNPTCTPRLHLLQTLGTAQKILTMAIYEWVWPRKLLPHVHGFEGLLPNFILCTSDPTVVWGSWEGENGATMCVCDVLRILRLLPHNASPWRQAKSMLSPWDL